MPYFIWGSLLGDGKQNGSESTLATVTCQSCEVAFNPADIVVENKGDKDLCKSCLDEEPLSTSPMTPTPLIEEVSLISGVKLDPIPLKLTISKSEIPFSLYKSKVQPRIDLSTVIPFGDKSTSPVPELIDSPVSPQTKNSESKEASEDSLDKKENIGDEKTIWDLLADVMKSDKKDDDPKLNSDEFGILDDLPTMLWPGNMVDDVKEFVDTNSKFGSPTQKLSQSSSFNRSEEFEEGASQSQNSSQGGTPILRKESIRVVRLKNESDDEVDINLEQTENEAASESIGFGDEGLNENLEAYNDKKEDKFILLSSEEEKEGKGSNEPIEDLVNNSSRDSTPKGSEEPKKSEPKSTLKEKSTQTEKVKKDDYPKAKKDPKDDKIEPKQSSKSIIEPIDEPKGRVNGDLNPDKYVQKEDKQSSTQKELPSSKFESQDVSNQSSLQPLKTTLATRQDSSDSGILLDSYEIKQEIIKNGGSSRRSSLAGSRDGTSRRGSITGTKISRQVSFASDFIMDSDPIAELDELVDGEANNDNQNNTKKSSETNSKSSTNQDNKSRSNRKSGNFGEDYNNKYGSNPPSNPNIRLTGNDFEKTKRQEIQQAIKNKDRFKLQQLSQSKLGLIDSSLRSEAWVILLKCDLNHSKRSKVLSHKDEPQILKDCRLAYRNFSQDMTSSKASSKRKELAELLKAIFQREPKLSYYQGFHEMASVLLLVLGRKKVANALQNISLNYLRDSMLGSLGPVMRQMALGSWIIKNEDSELHDFLVEAKVQSYYGLSWVLSWFSHNNPSVSHASRLFDLFISSDPIMPIYIMTTTTLARKDEILKLTCDKATVQNYLTKFPFEEDIELLIFNAINLYDKYPPSKLQNESQVSIGEISSTTRYEEDWNKIVTPNDYLAKYIKIQGYIDSILEDRKNKNIEGCGPEGCEIPDSSLESAEKKSSVISKTSDSDLKSSAAPPKGSGFAINPKLIGISLLTLGLAAGASFGYYRIFSKSPTTNEVLPECKSKSQLQTMMDKFKIPNVFHLNDREENCIPAKESEEEPNSVWDYLKGLEVAGFSWSKKSDPEPKVDPESETEPESEPDEPVETKKSILDRMIGRL